jgi:hypothetical protein
MLPRVYMQVGVVSVLWYALALPQIAGEESSGVEMQLSFAPLPLCEPAFRTPHHCRGRQKA